LIIAIAPNGARKTKADHPALPMTAPELAETAATCLEAGASMIHLHVRNKDGGHTLDADTYRQATRAIRDAVGNDIIVQVTSEAVGIYGPEAQMAMVRDVKPEAVSLAIREIVPDAAHESGAGEFLHWMYREHISPQYILYSDDDVLRFQDLIRRGVIPGDRHFVLFVLGRYSAGQISSPDDLLPFLGVKGSGMEWAVCAFGPRESACVLMAAALSGHARVGFENNLYLSNGSEAPDNAALVTQVADGAALLGRPVADADTARAILNA
jgi:uncharacterized protein (DUF849 family)